MVVEILHLTGTSRKVPVYASKKNFSHLSTLKIVFKLISITKLANMELQ